MLKPNWLRLKGGLRASKKLRASRRFVAQELEKLAVIIVRAGARGDVHDRAGVAAVLGAESRVINLEFLHGID